MCMVIHAYVHTVICTYTYSYTHIRAKLRTVVGIYSYAKLNVRALELLNPLTPGVEKKKPYFWTFSARKHDSMPFFPQASCFMTLLLGMSKIKICFFIFLHASFYC